MEDTFKFSTMSPGTFRKRLEQQGITLSTQDGDFLFQNFNADEKNAEVKKLTYQFLPMRIKELESCLETQNMNVIELKENLEYVLQREGQLMNEYKQYRQDTEETLKSNSNLQKQQQSELEKKNKLIMELQAQLSKKEEELQKMLANHIDNKKKLSDYIDKIKKFEFAQKEIEMHLQINEKELEYFKQENKQLRDEKKQGIQAMENMDKQIYDKETRMRQLLQDKKAEIDQYITRCNEMTNEIDLQQKDSRTKDSILKKLQCQLDVTGRELTEIKNSILELATLATSTNINNTLASMNYNMSEISALPYKYLSTFLELIRDALLKYRKKQQ